MNMRHLLPFRQGDTPHFRRWQGGRQSGFTLLELLMAMAVFSVMSAMAYGGLASVLAVRQTLNQQADDLAALQMTLYRLSVDVEQAIDRSNRNGMAQLQPSFSGGEGLEFFLEFTRSGWSNPRKIARSGMQRVAYALEDGVIRRYYWHTLDGMLQETPLSSSLLQGVLAVEIRFLDRVSAWQPFWPPNLGASKGAVREPLPRAVEMVIEKKGWGRIRRLFEVVVQK